MNLDKEKINKLDATLRFFDKVPSRDKYGDLERKTTFDFLERILPNFQKPKEFTPEEVHKKIEEAQGQLGYWLGQIDAGKPVSIPEVYAPAMGAIIQNAEYVERDFAPPKPPPDINQTIQNTLGPAGQVAQFGISKLASSVISKAALALGPIGKLASLIAPSLLSFTRRYGKELIVGAFTLGGFLLAGFGGAIVGGLGGVAVTGATGMGTTGGISGAANALTSGIQTFFAGLGGSVLGAAAAPLAFAIVATPIAIALIMFIINSGAYLVPPAPSLQQTGESPFIQVAKTTSPSGPFNNDDLPLTVEYTIEIKAPLSSLTNISFQDQCSVIRKGGNINCPPISSPIPEPPENLGGGQTFTIKYTVTYGPEYQDSIITDTFTVTADTPNQKRETTTGSASIIIGNPPTECFAFTGDWPASTQAKESAAISEMAQAETFMAQLCSGGEIKLVYSATQAYFQGKIYGGEISGPREITLYPAGIGSPGNALYTIAHESGHVYAASVGYKGYLDDIFIKEERPICTYPFSPHEASEDFAEMITLYLVQAPTTTTRSFDCLVGKTLKSKYPYHWQFARDKIFFEDLGW